MVVQHNISAMTANRYYGVNNKGLAGSLEKLASGYAINRAGDNAAGLAVSEKMRAQIGGLTQASKNAEDGISLVQTMEGALQETDSILQRMRTLAVQSANGSYQDDVDREAMQLEFDQLNDELNQIADTDFNGTVMLNGGQMADGLKANANGKFDYNTGKFAPTHLGKSDVDVVGTNLWDSSAATAASTDGFGSTLPTGVTNSTVANSAWYAMNSSWNRNDTNQNNDGPDSVDITFKYDSTSNAWTVSDATSGVNKNALKTVATTNGGFAVQIDAAVATATTAAANKNLANVVVDTTKVNNGDTITLTFNNPKNSISAPTNADSEKIDTTNFNGSAQELASQDLNVTVGSGLTDANMTKDYSDLLKKLDGATITTTMKKGVATAAGDISITTADGEVLAPNSASDTFTVGDTTFTLNATAGQIEIKDGSKSLMTIAMATQSSTSTTFSGTIDYKLGVQSWNYDESAVPSVEVSNTGSVSKSNAYDQSKATMTYTDHLGLQVGARTKDLVNFTFGYKSNGLGDLKSNLNCSSRTDGLGTADLSIADQKSANAAIDKIDNAINKVNMVRATFGAAQNRLEHKINNIDTNTENLTAAESRIRDTQMDKEMMKFTSAQILSQASQSMLAQANSLPQGVLQLLG